MTPDGDMEFLNDLAKQLKNEFEIMLPQERDEFTVRWFAKNVTNMQYAQARRFLERMVAEGRLIVRRKVKLTWGENQGRNADVYKWVPKRAQKKAQDVREAV